jgi:phosphocarrier protein
MQITEKVEIKNRLGFHLRIAAQFVKTTSRYKCRIQVKNHRGLANGKSLINLIALAAPFGSEMTLSYEGNDAGEACTAIRELFAGNFGEKV